MSPVCCRARFRRVAWCGVVWAVLALPLAAQAVVLWSDLGATLAHRNGKGTDILGGAVQRDDTASDTLYFKFHIDPLSDTRTEEYLAAFQLFTGPRESLGVGNSLKAWAYSAFNTASVGEFNKVSGDLDLSSARPESSGEVGTFFPYELPRRGVESTIVFKVEYIPGGDDRVTVWLNPDLGPGATEDSESKALRTSFPADGGFDEIRVRHEGGGGGWIFSDMAIATAFSDFVSLGGPVMGEIGTTNRDAAEFTFRAWQREQGLPQNAVRALAQTPDGYMWIGSDEDITRFDGVRFVTFGLREGLRVNRVRTLFADSRGTLWIGTSGSGLASFADGVFTVFTTKEGLPSDTIHALAEDNYGRIWVGTDAGLAMLHNGRIEQSVETLATQNHAVRALFWDREGAMWVGVAGQGVFRWKGRKSEQLLEDSLNDLLQQPHCLLVDRAGRIWIGAGDDYVLCREAGEWRRYRIPRNLARPYVSSLAEQPDGAVWAGSVSEGLFRFKDGKLTTVNASSGLSESAVESLHVDQHGRLWVGTGAGLNRLEQKILAAYGPNEGLGYGPAHGIVEVSPGVIWVAKPDDGVYQWSSREWAGKAFTRLGIGNSWGRTPRISALLVPRDGSCWLGGPDGLMRVKDPSTAPDTAEMASPITNAVSALAEDPSGTIWVGTSAGEVWTLQNRGWLRWPDFATTNPISALVLDGRGLAWVGTDGGGLFRVRGNSVDALTKADGLLSDVVRTLLLETDGTLWIGTAGGGLSRWRAGRVVNFTARDGLPDNTISQMLEDDQDRLWLGTDRGIACISKRELDEFANGRAAALYPHVFGRNDGMLSDECTGGFFPAGLKTRSGQLCFSTMKGIVVVNPRLQRPDSSPPRVAIEEVVIDDHAQSVRALVTEAEPTAGAAARPRLRIEPGNHRIEFRYTGLSFAAPERMRFRYRLEGSDADWVEAGTRRTAFYTYVPPGDYEFRVLACNADGVWSEEGGGIALTVLPHVWQSWWFIGLGSLALLGTVVGAVRLVERRKHQRRLRLIEQERALERERARIAQDLHDDLGSSLARISLLSSLAKDDKEHPEQVLSHVTKIAQSADETVRALEEIVWAVRPGSDSLQSLVEYIAHFSNELFEGNGTRCRLDLPHDLPALAMPPEVRHNIFLVVKEALTNVLKHAEAREVRVQAKAVGHHLEISVHDDGRGFNASQPAAHASTRDGLVNMRQRAAAIGGSLVVESGERGTTVRLTVDLSGQVKTGRD